MLRSYYDPVKKKMVFGEPPPAGASATLPEINVALPSPMLSAAPSSGRGALGPYFEKLEQERGLPAGFLAKTRAIESSNGTNLANPKSSARGDFQFIRSTAKEYGINPMDPYQSAQAAADMAKSNMAVMARNGINPDGGDLYAAHQQGIGGYLKLRRGQSPGDAEMALNGGASLSPSGFLGKWKSAYANAKPGNLGEGFVPTIAPSAGANQGQGPTVQAAAAMNAAPAPAAPPPGAYNGGLLGLFGVGPENAPGMQKDILGKLGDMSAQPGGGAIGGIAKALGTLGGAGQQRAQGGITAMPMVEDHKPDASLLAFLDPRRRRLAMMGA